ncbi:MAG: hypothetical protein ACRERD_10065, partial [Candidatus Binatia bacterium]
MKKSNWGRLLLHYLALWLGRHLGIRMVADDQSFIYEWYMNMVQTPADRLFTRSVTDNGDRGSAIIAIRA